MNERRVVVTGRGVLSCVGQDVATFWDSLVNGRCGLGKVTRFDVSAYRTQIAGEIKDFDPAKYINFKEAKRLDPFCQLAVCAAIQAVADAGLPANFADSDIDTAQIANANKNISEHLYAEGNSLQAAKLYNSSKQYYDSLGINRRLDRKEIEIIEIIESNQESSLPDMINKLLSRERTL